MSSISKLYEYLDALQGQATLSELVQHLQQTEIDCDDVQEHICFADHSYQRMPIRGGEWYQAWVMCWRNGQRSPIHDHKGSSCGVRILKGTLTETLFERAPNQHIKATCSRDMEPGQVLGGKDDDIHQVSNLQGDNADLITLHVYSPPLVYMGIYSLDSPHRERELMYVELTDAAGI